jgi:hypothetical protein
MSLYGQPQGCKRHKQAMTADADRPGWKAAWYRDVRSQVKPVGVLRTPTGQLRGSHEHVLEERGRKKGVRSGGEGRPANLRMAVTTSLVSRSWVFSAASPGPHALTAIGGRACPSSLKVPELGFVVLNREASDTLKSWRAGGPRNLFSTIFFLVDQNKLHV